jgi:hypothetical protein
MTEQFPAMPVPALRAVRSMRPLHATRCVRPLDVWLPRRVRCYRIYALIRTMLPGVATTNAFSNRGAFARSKTDVMTATFAALSADFPCRIA